MSLEVVTSIEAVRRRVAEARKRGLRIGLVPTMGALHEGHRSLIQVARRECDIVVLWLFVNPTQFGPHEDLTRYPRPFENDRLLCEREAVDLLFAPPVEVVYPLDHRTYVEVGGLQDVLEGASRPGHFRGVCTVVLKMLNMVQPDVAYFGQKDAQQTIVVKKMLADLDVPAAIRICPTVRESDGLALSSRNQYLSGDDRRRAVVLIEALRRGRDAILQGERHGQRVREIMEETVGPALEYAAVVDAQTLHVLTRIDGIALLAIAARWGGTRLIDNLVMRVDHAGANEQPTL